LESALYEELAQLKMLVSELQTKVGHLEASQTVETSSNQTRTTRRKLLKKLAMGVLGMGVASTALLPKQVEARTIINPSGHNNRVGSIILPPNASNPQGSPSGTGKLGLIASSNTNGLNLSEIDGNSDIGVVGISSNTGGIGLLGNSDSGNGVVASSNTGAPLRIIPGSQPSSGSQQIGQMYVDVNGNLNIWATNNPGLNQTFDWKPVQFSNIVAGIVNADGTIQSGSGFTVSRPISTFNGIYNISIDLTGFSSFVPLVNIIASSIIGISESPLAYIKNFQGATFTVITGSSFRNGNYLQQIDLPFSLLVIGI